MNPYFIKIRSVRTFNIPPIKRGYVIIFAFPIGVINPKFVISPIALKGSKHKNPIINKLRRTKSNFFKIYGPKRINEIYEIAPIIREDTIENIIIL